MIDNHQEHLPSLEALPFFGGHSADAAWVRAAKAVVDGRHEPQIGRGGQTAEILHATLRITDPRQRWVTSRRPAMNPAFAIAETFWILGGRDDAHFVNFWNPALPRFAGRSATYAGAYGRRLRQAFGFDQIERALDALSASPSSRQVVLQIWDPRSDFPTANGNPVSADVPCNVCSILKVRNSRLEWMQIMRSNDIFRGTPYNLVQFTFVQEYMAGCLGLEVGEFVLVADSLHAYQDDIGKFSIVPSSLPPSECRIALTKDLAAITLGRCVDLLDKLADTRLTKDCFHEIVRASNIPAGHADLLRIAAADSARRRGWLELADRAVDACTDSFLREAWSLWASDRSTAQRGGRLGATDALEPRLSAAVTG
ncbi:thymidylate synthase [Mesorhizobium sp. MSK_1335]|uniref:thymidylate synthase n=1 Tax=Mesorhizobium montanum TaxID=3072323 RepID=A0ABU4ZQS9_9HYPH|nr:thymidylate synthase [Mesorhizobium sp. MSK_1335]MDX8527753.1 thymidylate synthase [Mesorhizobium sp. MSK_1335]